MKSDNRRLTFAARPARAANGGSRGAVAGVKNTNQASISIEVRRNKINMPLTLSRRTSHWNFQSAREKDTRGIRIKNARAGLSLCADPTRYLEHQKEPLENRFRHEDSLGRVWDVRPDPRPAGPEARIHGLRTNVPRRRGRLRGREGPTQGNDNRASGHTPTKKRTRPTDGKLKHTLKQTTRPGMKRRGRLRTGGANVLQEPPRPGRP